MPPGHTPGHSAVLLEAHPAGCCAPRRPVLRPAAAEPPRGAPRGSHRVRRCAPARCCCYRAADENLLLTPRLPHAVPRPSAPSPGTARLQVEPLLHTTAAHHQTLRHHAPSPEQCSIIPQQRCSDSCSPRFATPLIWRVPHRKQRYALTPLQLTPPPVFAQLPYTPQPLLSAYLRCAYRISITPDPIRPRAPSYRVIVFIILCPPTPFSPPDLPDLPAASPGTGGGPCKVTRARPALDLRQSPRSLRNLLVYSSADVPETELQVGDAYVVVVAQGVSRSSDQKCSPARPLPAA